MDALVVEVAGSTSEARALLEGRSFDLVTLEIDPDSEEGMLFAREVRALHDPAIIIVTNNTDRSFRIAALKDVADDYIVKPFDVHEVLARAQAVLRRSKQRLQRAASPQSAARSDDGHILRAAGYALDPGTRRFTAPSGASVELTATEFKLLDALITNRHRVVSRERLLELSGGDGTIASFDRAIDMRIRRLRSKIENGEIGATDLIRTVRGVGYKFSPPDNISQFLVQTPREARIGVATSATSRGASTAASGSQ
jgi:DNA-binding response OmpR family regulator